MLETNSSRPVALATTAEDGLEPVHVSCSWIWVRCLRSRMFVAVACLIVGRYGASCLCVLEMYLQATLFRQTMQFES